MTRVRKGLGALAVFGLAVGFGAAVTAQDERMAKMELTGGYTIVKGERDGEPIPAEKIKGTVARFTKDEVKVITKDKKDLYVSKYKLDVSRTPYKITMTTVAKKDMKSGSTEKPKAPPGGDAGEESSTTGLVKKEGDLIVLIYALPGGKDPTEFKTKQGDKTLMFWLRNQNKSGSRSDR